MFWCISCRVSPQSWVPQGVKAGTTISCLPLVSPALCFRPQPSSGQATLALSACFEQPALPENACPVPGTRASTRCPALGAPAREASRLSWQVSMNPRTTKKLWYTLWVENVFPLQCWCGPRLAGLFTYGFPKHLQSWAEQLRAKECTLWCQWTARNKCTL